MPMKMRTSENSEQNDKQNNKVVNGRFNHGKTSLVVPFSSSAIKHAYVLQKSNKSKTLTI